MDFILENSWIAIYFVLFALVYYIYIAIQKRYKYFEERGIPFIKPVFLLGSTFRFIMGLEQMSECFSKLADRVKGEKIFGVFQFLKPIIVIRDPEVVNQILIKEFSHFQDHGFPIDEKNEPLEGHLFNLSGEKWRAMRKKLSPTFTSGKLKWMFDQMFTCANLLLSVVDVESKQGDVEIKDVMTRFTTDVIGSCGFGYEPEAIKDPNCRFRIMGRKVFEVSPKEAILMGLRIAFPNIYFKLKLSSISKDVGDFFNNLVSQTFEHRIKTGQSRNDFIQLLLQLKTKGKIEVDPKDRDEENEELAALGEVSEHALELTDGILAAQAFVFFFAGFETSASGMSYALYLLSKHSEIQDKVRAEIKRVKAKHQEQYTYEALKEMTYLDCCISESMRILSPLDILMRKCNKNSIVNGMRIDKGMGIVIPVRSLHKDPQYFPNPTEFKPERFVDGGANIIPGTYLPFGNGPRICIARRFALLEMKLALAMILENYVVTKSPKLIEPIKFKPSSFLNDPLHGIWLNLKKIE